jgi:hypothetical protein
MEGELKKKNELATLNPQSGSMLVDAAKASILQVRTREFIEEVSAKMVRIENLNEVIERSRRAIDFYQRQIDAIQNNRFTVQTDYRHKIVMTYNESELNGQGPEHGG